VPERSTKTRILTAAHQVILTQGADALTLETVAEVAGLSKGGLLYHFPSKEALLEALVAEWIATFERDVAEQQRGDAPPRTRGSAYLRATVEGTVPAGGAALLASIAHERGTLSLAREHAEAWQDAVASDPDPVVGTVLRLAADGLFWSDLLDMAPLRGPLRERVVGFLLGLVDEGAAG